jgi:hypothetical protein
LRVTFISFFFQYEKLRGRLKCSNFGFQNGEIVIHAKENHADKPILLLLEREYLIQIRSLKEIHY